MQKNYCRPKRGTILKFVLDSIMNGQFIPDHIAQFIIEKIHSVAQLEALLLLRSSAQEQWTIQALASRLYISEEQTADVLSYLCAQGFAVPIESPLPGYRYQPSSVDLRDMLDRVAEIYSKHLVPVTNLIHSKPKARIQEFADAFKFRKDL